METCQGIGVAAGREELGNAKSEELRCAVRRHQHVARLQIAMNDKVAVSILHGCAHLPKQRQSLPYGEGLAEFGDRLAVHVLHHEVRQSSISRTAVEQPR